MQVNGTVFTAKTSAKLLFIRHYELDLLKIIYTLVYNALLFTIPFITLFAYYNKRFPLFQ